MHHQARRIVSLQPSVSVILSELCQLDRLVACTRYCADVVPELRRRGCLIVSDSWTAKSAEILAAQPDLVIAAVPYQLEAVSEILKAGIRFLGLAPKTLADIYTDIATIAGAIGVSAPGQQLIERMQDGIALIRARSSELPKRRVFCEEWGKPLIASQPWVAELIAAAGGEFVGEPGKQILPEAVAQLQPDVLIAAWCGADDRVPLEKIVAQRNWGGLAAVQSAQVYCISDELLNTPAPTLLLGLTALAAAIHPESFPPPSPTPSQRTKALRRISSVPELQS